MDDRDQHEARHNVNGHQRRDAPLLPGDPALGRLNGERESERGRDGDGALDGRAANRVRSHVDESGSEPQGNKRERDYERDPRDDRAPGPIQTVAQDYRQRDEVDAGRNAAQSEVESELSRGDPP